jgi:uncharacterized protein YcbX
VRIKELWRCPVKSLQGERLHEALVTADGLDGDRRYAIFELGTGLGLTARRVPQLLFASASLARRIAPTVTTRPPAPRRILAAHYRIIREPRDEA